jgi:hypothetical protein
MHLTGNLIKVRLQTTCPCQQTHLCLVSIYKSLLFMYGIVEVIEKQIVEIMKPTAESTNRFQNSVRITIMIIHPS